MCACFSSCVTPTSTLIASFTCVECSERAVRKAVDRVQSCSDPSRNVGARAATDPSKCGYKYTMSPNRGDVRSSWFCPSSTVDEHKCGDCTKRQFEYQVSHRSRAGLWIWVCLQHERIVGWHIMPKHEGRRDPLLSLYRMKEKAPKVILVDFSCGAEESSLNWAPEFFMNTSFYHDIFHGYTHKCTDRFKCDRVEILEGMNSSIMEQVRGISACCVLYLCLMRLTLRISFVCLNLQINSHLQPLRGILKSGSTKVCGIPWLPCEGCGSSLSASVCSLPGVNFSFVD